MVNEIVLQEQCSLVEYTQLGGMDSSVFDYWQYSAGFVLYANCVTLFCLKYLTCMARGFVAGSLFAASASGLFLPFCLSQLAFQRRWLCCD